MVLFVGFYSMEAPDSRTGRTGYYLTDGQFIYMSVVTLVNIKILTSSHTYSFFSFFLTLGSIATFVLFFFFLNLWPSDDIYKEFNQVFGHQMFYLSLLFVGGALLLVDNGLHLIQYKMNQLLEDKEKLRQSRIKYLIDQDHAVPRKRLTTLSRIL